MFKWKRWLVERYLPAYCRQRLMEENRRLAEQAEALKAQLAEQQAYIRGIHRGMGKGRGEER